ncbi:restriction endonuclease subunit S [Bacillus smithii]|uniref:restriction endonuclease subunit S n=1 Tax=Bacillus smithii TaxID=1479 RepID=UPI003D212733
MNTELVEKSEFKRSRFGMIPKSWDEKSIGTFTKTSSGGTPKRDNKAFYKDGNINWFKTGELVSKYLFESEEKITEEAVKKSSAKLFPKETLLVAMYGATIGKLSILKEESATNQACCAILPNENYNTEYLYYQLSFLKNKLIRRGAGGAQPNISQDIVKTFPVPFPKKAEQEKIASILSTWDKAIELKEKLIEQKKKQKKGLMQKLLTGEVRLPSFDKEWKEVKLAELGECIRGVSYKPEDLYLEDNNNSIRLLRSNNILGNTLVIKDIQFVDKSKVKKKQLLKKTDVVISMANGSKKLVGKNGVFNSKSNYFYTVGAFCAIFRFNQKSSANFAKFLFQTNKYNYYVQNLLAGSNINNLKPSDIESMKFFIPTEIQEQNEIAKVLDSASNEINVLEKELEALKQQKKGLMQLLLTGKVRVKV